MNKVCIFISFSPQVDSLKSLFQRGLDFGPAVMGLFRRPKATYRVINIKRGRQAINIFYYIIVVVLRLFADKTLEQNSFSLIIHTS